ncbi:hypothetical protein [Bradyrhizobium erythrophlei]|uniref:Uncharacterized protein n=1 Tax=Bradyrhizobium erythrophlei TaxID=1437360 RepID=A0A1H5D443_9BRAD|nr:hypothetical protein [Bradyrhizobium erythrophlei]SED73520.1 hypothetical protein SAMN05444164_5632 [Bradyrhizobium erythrophlei]
MAMDHGGNGQLDDGKLHLTADDLARAKLGPRGVPGAPDLTRMTSQQAKNYSGYVDRAMLHSVSLPSNGTAARELFRHAIPTSRCRET